MNSMRDALDQTRKAWFILANGYDAISKEEMDYVEKRVASRMAEAFRFCGIRIQHLLENDL